jgi:excinuclease ABC subunit B
VNAQVVLYADTVTPSMKRAMDETDRRRTIQLQYNQDNGITPQTIEKEIRSSLERMVGAYKVAAEAVELSEQELDRAELISMLEKEMLEAADTLEFEKAARIRDRIKELREMPEIVKA